MAPFIVLAGEPQDPAALFCFCSARIEMDEEACEDGRVGLKIILGPNNPDEGETEIKNIEMVFDRHEWQAFKAFVDSLFTHTQEVKHA